MNNEHDAYFKHWTDRICPVMITCTYLLMRERLSRPPVVITCTYLLMRERLSRPPGEPLCAGSGNSWDPSPLKRSWNLPEPLKEAKQLFLITIDHTVHVWMDSFNIQQRHTLHPKSDTGYKVSFKVCYFCKRFHTIWQNLSLKRDTALVQFWIKTYFKVIHW